MIILGINAFGHDAAAILLVDGEVVHATSQERKDRRRHSAAFPAEAIEACLGAAGLGPGDVEGIAFPWRRGMARWRKALHVLRGWPRTRAFLRERPGPDLPSRRAYLQAMRGLPRRLAAMGLRAHLHHVAHHEAHAASARLAQPGDGPLAILTADGMGEWTTTATWHAHGAALDRLRHASYPHSAGKLYAAVTAWLGFRPESDEGKTMGLAAYGDGDAPAARFTRALLAPHPRHLLAVDRTAVDFPWGRARLWGEAFRRHLGEPRRPGEPLRDGDADAARGIQDALETTMEAIARQALAATGATRLGLAGGIFLNCALNGRLARRLDADVRPFPVAGDAGAAWGAAARCHRLLTSRPAAPLTSLRLGHAIGDAEARAALGDAAGRPDDLPAAVAALVADGAIVAVARGRAELGPRALGGRSLLGTPRSQAARDRLNAHKGREAWRPLAPVVRARDAGRYGAMPLDPYMIRAAVVPPAEREAIAGAVHVDGTARIQTVTPEDEPFLHGVLDALAARGEPPVVLNTSLNRPGEPIVDTAREAVDAAEAMACDAIVVADRLRISRPASRRG